MINKKERKVIFYNVENTDDNFVGLKYNNGKIEIIFPLGYRIPSERKEQIQSIKLLFKTIKLTQQQKIYTTEIGKYKEGENGLPIDSFQWIINDYIENGIYMNIEKNFSQDSKGKINWKRTFKTKFLINKKSLVFLDTIVEKNNNIKNIISEIHAYCIDKSTEILWFMYNGISKISNIKNPNLKSYLNIINKEMLSSFDDRKKTLLYHMKRIIQSEIDGNGKQKIRNYGIRYYEYVWEYMIDELFGNIETKKFYPYSKYNIGALGKPFNSSRLRPDTILVDDEKNFYIIDAKYYKATTITNDNRDLKSQLPSTSSIQKQITYADFIYKNYKEEEKINNIYNAFVLPYNKNKNLFNVNGNIENIGTAKCTWKDIQIPSDEIQLIVIDTKYLIELYFNKENNKKILIEKIENSDNHIQK